MGNHRFGVRLPKSLFRKLKNHAISSPAKDESTASPKLEQKFQSQDVQCVDLSGKNQNQKKKKIKRRKLQWKLKTKVSVNSMLLADCGCRSRPYVLVTPGPQSPDICIAPSLSRISVESVDGFSDISSSYTVPSFDEMLKRPSKKFQVYQVQSESGHVPSKLKDNNISLELQIPSYNFNDLVAQLRRKERLTRRVGSYKKTNHTNGHKLLNDVASPKVNSTRQISSAAPTSAAKKKVQYTAQRRRSVSNNKGRQFTDSLAIMKPSSDPQREFRESMMEMIAENKIMAGKDLEELLVCYLLLNSADYHDVIVQVFQQIWSEIIQTQSQRL